MTKILSPRIVCWLACLAAVMVSQIAIAAVDAPAATAEKPTDEVARVAALIDRSITQRLDEENLAPAPLADDAEYLRRVYLDVAGRIPSVAEARRFLKDARPDKRRRLVDRLLEESGYVMNFSAFWRDVMLPEASSDFNTQFRIPGFEAWLRDRIAMNMPFNDLVFELLIADIDGDQVSPTAFYQSKDIKPENLAASTSRMFLGVRLECAQCHDHPFDTWEQKEFWEFAAFFAGLERNGGNQSNNPIREFFTRRTLKIPDTDIVAFPVYLDGTKPRLGFGQSSREALARWVSGKDNPYFARMTVNRLWDHFFGRGFVTPVDDFSDNNPPSHPELLEALAKEIVAHNYNLKFFMRAILVSDTYQRSSKGGSPSRPEHFSKMAVKGLSPHQIYHSLAQAIGKTVPFNPRDSYIFGRNDATKTAFLERFSDEDPNPQERQTTVLQALALMNGKIVTEATKLEGSRTLAAVAEFPGLSPEQQVETLFLATLTRQPDTWEESRFSNYVRRGGPKNSSEEALADVLWVLLNTSEFLFNH